MYGFGGFIGVCDFVVVYVVEKSIYWFVVIRVLI